MKVLLDECLPIWLRAELDEFDVYTVEYAGLKGQKDHQLLDLIEGNFDCLVTFDRSLVSQQRIGSRGFSVIVLVVSGQTRARILPLLPALRKALKGVKPGRSYLVEER